MREAEGWEQIWETDVQTVFRITVPFTPVITLFSVFPQASERCFSFQGTTNNHFQNIWCFSFAVTNRFTFKKFNHTAHPYLNRYSLFTDCVLSSYKVEKERFYSIFHWKNSTFLVKASISDGSLRRRFWHNVVVRKTIKAKGSAIFYLFQSSCLATLDYDCLLLDWWQLGNTKHTTAWAAIKNQIFNIWSASAV